MKNREENPRVAVLVLGYNHANTVVETLSCARSQTYPNYEVIYIDNASSDDSLSRVRGNFPDLRTIAHTKNLGYAGAYKQALDTVFEEEFEMAILLNPDTSCEATWLAPLVQCALAHKQVACIQPKIYLWTKEKTRIFNTAGNAIHYLGIGFCGRYKEPDSPPITKDLSIPYASGASLLIKKDVYRNLPGFDEDFFAYLEDQDLGWQARMLGYDNILCANSVLWHRYDFRKKALGGYKMFLLERNRLLFLVKHFETKTLLLLLPALLVLEVAILLHSALNGYFLKKIHTYWSFLRLLPSAIKKRKVLQKKRVKSDRQLLTHLSPAIHFEEISSPALSLANKFFTWYYTIIRSCI